MSSTTNTRLLPRIFPKLSTQLSVSSDRPTNEKKPNEGYSSQVQISSAFQTPGRYFPPTQIKKLYGENKSSSLFS